MKILHQLQEQCQLCRLRRLRCVRYMVSRVRMQDKDRVHTTGILTGK